MKADVIKLAESLGIPPHEMPNDEQIEAIDSLDGPVMVIAGPGTGKTQLLSLRVANILTQKDVSAENILCLTFTNAGTDAISSRLLKFIGAEAYKVRVGTFHSFAASIRSEYPQFFGQRAFAAQITELQASAQIDRLLRELPHNDPLPAGINNGRHNQLGAMKAFIKSFKTSGISPDEFRGLIQQSKDYCAFLAEQPGLLPAINAVTSVRDSHAKRQLLAEIVEIITRTPALAPASLVTELVHTPGIYVPYARYLSQLFNETQLIAPEGEGDSTEGFRSLRGKLFAQNAARDWDALDTRVFDRALSAIGVYEDYCSFLVEHEFYDYDDMILETLAAIESSPQLRSILQERYRYIQIDEFQDTNGVQMRLVDLLCQGIARPNLLIVGDDDQSIMRFQGASVEFINQFEQHLPNVRRIVLNTNYRSTPALVELGQAVAQQIGNRSKASRETKQLRASRQQETYPEHFAVHVYANDQLQYYALAQSIRARLDAGYLENSQHRGEEIAVITYRNDDLKALIPYLKHFQIPFSYTFTTTVGQIAALQALLAVIDFAGYYANGQIERAQSYLPAILAAPEFGLESQDYIEFAFFAREQHLARNWLAACAISTNEKIRALYDWLIDLVTQAAAAPVRATIYAAARPMIDYQRSHADADPLALAEFNYGLEALLRFVADELGAYDHGLAEAPLRLTDVVQCFAAANRFGIEVKVELPIKREGAIRLTTAHSSKGLEFDLVYLMHADDSNWYGRPSSSSLIPANCLFANAHDDDDVRRLLFVAATRARYELVATRAQAGTVRELMDILIEVEEPAELTEILDQSQAAWEECYRLDSASLVALAKPHLDRIRISASTLNKFVDYRQGGANSQEFAAGGLLSIPQAPAAPLEFGSCMHEFLEQYITQVLVAKADVSDKLVSRCKRRLASLDFDDTELSRLEQRFDAIVKQFLPLLPAYVSGTAISEGWINAVVDGVPITGACDLLVLDEASRTITCLDFKTASGPPTGPARNYLRQLQFYRLLVESSEKYAGWRLKQAADIYIEPMRDLGFELLPVEFITTSDAELLHLRRLTRAVYWRISQGLFDTSAFEASELYQEVAPQRFNAGGEAPKKDYDAVQQAYELWLIEEWEQQS